MTGRTRLGLVSAAMLLAWSVPAIGIVGGKEVTEVEQLRRGLVTVGGGCSGILISED